MRIMPVSLSSIAVSITSGKYRVQLTANTEQACGKQKSFELYYTSWEGVKVHYLSYVKLCKGPKERWCLSRNRGGNKAEKSICTISEVSALGSWKDI